MKRRSASSSANAKRVFAELAEQQGLIENQSAFYALSSPVEALAARLFMIDEAQTSLCLQYYLFKEDVIGSLLIEHLLQAAERGVSIRLLLDDLQGARRGASFALLASHDNVQIKLFNPNVFRGLFRGLIMLLRLEKLGRRMHNKAMIVDDECALIGGRNLGAEYFLSDDERMFLDYDVMAMGGITPAVNQAFESYWQSSLSKPLNQLDITVFSLKNHQHNRQRHLRKVADFQALPIAEMLHHNDFSQQLQQGNLAWEVADAQLFVDPPEKIEANHPIEHTFAFQLNDALQVERSLVLISPYFIPTHAGLERFRQYRQQGIKVQVLTNSLASTDVTAVYSAYQAYQRQLLEMGVELYELRPKTQWMQNRFNALSPTWRWLKRQLRQPKWFKSHRFFQYWHRHQLSLHTKLAVVDGRYLLAGSANADPRSRKLNTEMLVVIDSEKMAQEELSQLTEILSADIFYRLSLQDNCVVWQYDDGGRQVTTSQIPETSHWRKLTTLLMSFLPIEGYL